jgi:hypothetical protein
LKRQKEITQLIGEEGHDETIWLFLFINSNVGNTTKVIFVINGWAVLLHNVLGGNMKTITTLALFLFLTGCGYTMKLGKKCTPGHDEWSYVWFIQKDGNNVSRENCKR